MLFLRASSYLNRTDGSSSSPSNGHSLKDFLLLLLIQSNSIKREVNITLVEEVLRVGTLRNIEVTRETGVGGAAPFLNNGKRVLGYLALVDGHGPMHHPWWVASRGPRAAIQPHTLAR